MSTSVGRRYVMPGRNSVKNEKQYEVLRDKGMSKESSSHRQLPGSIKPWWQEERLGWQGQSRRYDASERRPEVRAAKRMRNRDGTRSPARADLRSGGAAPCLQLCGVPGATNLERMSCHTRIPPARSLFASRRGWRRHSWVYPSCPTWIAADDDSALGPRAERRRL